MYFGASGPWPPVTVGEIKEAGTLKASDKQARDCLQIPFGMKYRLGGSAPELGM